MCFTTISYRWWCQVSVQLFCFAVPEGGWVSAWTCPTVLCLGVSCFSLAQDQRLSLCDSLPRLDSLAAVEAWEMKQDQALKPCLGDHKPAYISLCSAFANMTSLAIKQERALSSSERKRLLWQVLSQRLLSLLGSVHFHYLQFSMFPVYLYYFRNPFPSG